MAIQYDNTLLDFYNFCKEKGFYYNIEQLYNFYISLKTKPFVILTGISGSGKSKIADLFAEYFSESTSTENNYELVSVKPNWTDSKGVFGFHNIINDTYEITPTLRLFIRAILNPQNYYFLVLDEMNLAKVEYYFSDFLSLLESRRISKETNPEKIFKKFPKTPSLSETLILSALSIDKNEFMKIEEYRNHPICEKWLETSNSDNKIAQFRTELNQGRHKVNDEMMSDGIRMAGQAFWSKVSGNQYKLKRFDEMSEDLKNRVLELNKALYYLKQDKISLHSSPTPLKTLVTQDEFQTSLIDDLGNYYVPNEIEIPTNVFVIGTVNVDETTYMFSPKVLDRANVVEYNEVDLYGAYNFGQPTYTISSINSPLKLNISFCDANSTKMLIREFPEIFDIVFQIYYLLKNYNKHFGYRVFNEISQFILNYVDGLEDNSYASDALDLQILQKVLPKLNGSEDEILDLLNELAEITHNNNLQLSLNKLEKMIERVKLSGYVTFIE